MMLDSKGGENVANLRSTPIDFKPLETKEMVSYWDTEGVREGEYNGELFVRYGQTRSTDKNLLLRVSPNDLQITGVGFAIRPSGRGGVNITTLLMILVILMLIVNLAWFVFFTPANSTTKRSLPIIWTLGSVTPKRLTLLSITSLTPDIASLWSSISDKSAQNQDSPYLQL